jgi:hypothetical protein
LEVYNKVFSSPKLQAYNNMTVSPRSEVVSPRNVKPFVYQTSEVSKDVKWNFDQKIKKSEVSDEVNNFE